jgi:Sec-independent protein translocase protein TatA
MQTIPASGPMLAVMTSGLEFAVVAGFLLILFGCKRFSDFIRGMRQGIYEFRKASKGALWGLDDQAGDAGKSLGGIHGKLAAEALTEDNQTFEIYDPEVLKERKKAAGGSPKAGRRHFRFSPGAWRRVVLAVLVGTGLIILIKAAIRIFRGSK